MRGFALVLLAVSLNSTPAQAEKNLFEQAGFWKSLGLIGMGITYPFWRPFEWAGELVDENRLENRIEGELLGAIPKAQELCSAQAYNSLGISGEAYTAASNVCNDDSCTVLGHKQVACRIAALTTNQEKNWEVEALSPNVAILRDELGAAQ